MSCETGHDDAPTTNPDDDCIITKPSHYINTAKGRWKILQAAILRSRSVSTATATASHAEATRGGQSGSSSSSIHRFHGFDWIPEPRILRASESSEPNEIGSTVWSIAQLRRSLTRLYLQPEWDVARLIHTIQCSLAALQALDDTPVIVPSKGIAFTVEPPLHISLDDDTPPALDRWSRRVPVGSLEWVEQVTLALQRHGYDCCYSEDSENGCSTSSAQLLICHCPDIASTTTTTTTTTNDAVGATRSEYCLKEYRIPIPTTDQPLDINASLPSLTLLTRERSLNRRFTLQELVSHRTTGTTGTTTEAHTAGVDNTGNICVWDCERTLTWAILLDAHTMNTPLPPMTTTTTTTTVPYDNDMLHSGGKRHHHCILEIGAGMAGLAAWSYAVAWSKTSTNTATLDVIITDGHYDCVFNNQVNERLMSSAGLLPDNVHIDCRHLVWSTDLGPERDNSIQERSSSSLSASAQVSAQASVTLVSDCTHFQEWHSELLWTLLYHTRIGGCIWMCQPLRGTSWQRFARLVQAVNEPIERDTTTLPLVSLSEPAEIAARLQRRHEETARDCVTYDANVHRPYVYCLTKLREGTPIDRDCMLRFKQEVTTSG